jgi:UDP-glucose 4-epimerase
LALELEGSNILITGGAGFIGSHLADRLLESGCKVTVLDNFDDFYGGKEANVMQNIGREGYRLVRGDVLDYDVVSSLSKKADYIFHMAARPGVRQSIQEPRGAHQANATGTLNVLLAAKEGKPRKVVYASSSSVYGCTDQPYMREDHPTRPTSPYAASKLAAENYCVAFSKSYNLPVTCLRYFSVYGPRGRPDQPVYRFTAKILSGGKPAIFGDGNQTRDFTYISDVVEATILAATSERCDGEILNIGFGNEISIKEVAQKIISRLDREGIELEYYPGYDGDFPRTLADNTKARNLLGWRAKVNLDDGLDRFLDWCSKMIAPGIWAGANR